MPRDCNKKSSSSEVTAEHTQIWVIISKNCKTLSNNLNLPDMSQCKKFIVDLGPTLPTELLCSLHSVCAPGS